MSEEEKQSETTPEEAQVEIIPWATFLKEWPVGLGATVREFGVRDPLTGHGRKSTPTLTLYCEECKGNRNFDGDWTHSDSLNCQWKNDFLVYTCLNCKRHEKHYCLRCRNRTAGLGEVIKVGEYPELHVPLPTNLHTLLGPDYDCFIKGLKCEKQGLGVAAYAYYRRVVENQKDRIFGEILKVAKKVSAKPEVLKVIQDAAEETQFSKAIDTIKDMKMWPESLLIDGHNPFKLVHKSLSICLHNQPDETCLGLAHDIRIVLTDLCERIKSVLSEQRELKESVSSILKFNQENK